MCVNFQKKIFESHPLLNLFMLSGRHVVVRKDTEHYMFFITLQTYETTPVISLVPGEPSRVIDEKEETYLLIHSLQDANMTKFLCKLMRRPLNSMMFPS